MKKDAWRSVSSIVKAGPGGISSTASDAGRGAAGAPMTRARQVSSLAPMASVIARRANSL